MVQEDEIHREEKHGSYIALVRCVSVERRKAMSACSFSFVLFFSLSLSPYRKRR